MPWADDWATYIQDALNILHGNRYSTTGYIANPDTNIGPTAYPPLYPLTLVLPIALRGVDFHAIREFQLIFWGIFLVFVHFLARRRLNGPLSLLVVFAVGLSPYFFEFKNYIASEALFLAVLWPAFMLSARISEASPNGDMSAGNGILLGVLVGLCTTTRSVGLVLIPTLAVYDLLSFRRIRRGCIIAILTAASAFLVQLVVADFFNDYLIGIGVSSRSDLDTTGMGPATTRDLTATFWEALSVGPHRLGAFLVDFSRFWGQGANASLLPRIASIVFGLLAIYGFLRSVAREVMLCDVFATLYCMILMALPPDWVGARMEMPLVPLFYTYVVVAASSLGPASLRRAGVLVVLALGVLSYLQSYENLDFHSPLEGIHKTDYAEMFKFIRQNTEPDSGIIFDKPRTLALYTHRRSAAIYNTRKGDSLMSYMRQIGARYILFYDPWEGNVSREQYVRDRLGNHIGEFGLIYDSGPYALYGMMN